MDELLDTAPCGFLSFTDDGVITTVNTTLLELLGYERSELVGQSIERILTVGTRIFYQTHFFPLIRMHGRAEEIFLMLRSASGAEIGVLANAVRHTRGGAPANDCVFMRVSERQKYEQELLLARRAAEGAHAELRMQHDELEAANDQLEEQAAELEAAAEELQMLNTQLMDRTEALERLRVIADEANRAKSNFLAMMSHELRTPLNAIAGYAQLLEMGVQGPVTEPQRVSLKRIEQSQRHLLRLVNELLNLARVESGRVDYDVTDVDLNAAIREVLPLVEPQMQQKRLQLSIDIPHSIVVRADREKMLQVILNLLSNAIKFTPEDGAIEISASRKDPTDEVEIRVRDTGVGIPAQMLDAIFDPFVQVEVQRSRRAEGTGLGLAISRDLARGMGGDLTATSEEGVGSTFVLTLKAGAVEPAAVGTEQR